MATLKRLKGDKKRVWLSYDLGLRGNYEALYEWLDEKGAKECGDSFATFLSDRTFEELGVELHKLLGDNSKARIYIISADRGGQFILGKRKAAPWTGYSQTAVDSVMDR